MVANPGPALLADLTSVTPPVAALLAQLPLGVQTLVIDPSRTPSLFPTDELIVRIGRF